MRQGRTYKRCGSSGALPIFRFFRYETAPSGFAGKRGAQRLDTLPGDQQALGDARAIVIEAGGFASGSLSRVSYARPGKIFTANLSLIIGQAGILKTELCYRIVESVGSLLRGA
jgi:hypothetical protein